MGATPALTPGLPPPPPPSAPIRFGLMGKLSLGIGLLALLTMMTALAALWALDRFQRGFEEVAVERQQILTATARLVQSTESLAAATPRLIAAQDSFALQWEKSFIADVQMLNSRAFDHVVERGLDPALIEDILALRQTMDRNLEALARLVEERLNARAALDDRLQALNRQHSRLHQAMEAEGATPSLHAAIKALEQTLPLAMAALAHGFPAEIHRLRDQTQQILSSLDTHPSAAEDWHTLQDILTGEEGVFALRLKILEVGPKLHGVMLENNALSRRLPASATNLFVSLERQTTEEHQAFLHLIEAGWASLLVVIASTVLAAGFIFWYLRQRVIARLTGLQRCMTERASGQAPPIPLDGRDEVTAMARALDYFVRTIAEKEQALAHLAATDSLTGLPNRRAFAMAADHEFERFRRYGEGAALILLDLDHFKRVNDTHGHSAGDVALVATARCLCDCLHGSDHAGRMGGRSFPSCSPMLALTRPWFWPSASAPPLPPKTSP